MPNEDFPLRVDGVTAGWAAERRPEDVIPAARTDAWQLVYVRSGTIEERCDDRRVLLRAGGLLFHQPAETFGMRPVGEVPPDVLRLDFLCTQAIHLENLLILLARRYKRARKPGVRLRRERRQTALVDAARTYFAKNLERELRVDEVCEAIGCTRPQLQAAFRTRLRHTAMEEFSAMRLDYAAQLLARGDTPGEVAERMGYRSGAYFSQKFKEATGNTPSAYRRLQQGLPARRLNRQQKDKDESKTSIAETPPKK